MANYSKFNYEIDWDTAQGIVKVALREDAKMIKKEIDRLEEKKALTNGEIADLKRNRDFLSAISVLRNGYYGA